MVVRGVAPGQSPRKTVALGMADEVLIPWFGVPPLGGLAQAFQPAGSGDFSVPSCKSRNTGLESPVNPQTGMSALHLKAELQTKRPCFSRRGPPARAVSSV